MATSSSGQRRFVGPDDGNEELHLSGSSYDPMLKPNFFVWRYFQLITLYILLIVVSYANRVFLCVIFATFFFPNLNHDYGCMIWSFLRS